MPGRKPLPRLSKAEDQRLRNDIEQALAIRGMPLRRFSERIGLTARGVEAILGRPGRISKRSAAKLREGLRILDAAVVESNALDDLQRALTPDPDALLRQLIDPRYFETENAEALGYARDAVNEFFAMVRTNALSVLGRQGRIVRKRRQGARMGFSNDSRQR